MVVETRQEHVIIWTVRENETVRQAEVEKMEQERACVCVCVCACACVCVHASVCVCVREICERESDSVS